MPAGGGGGYTSGSEFVKNFGRSTALQAVTRNEIDENSGNGREKAAADLISRRFHSFSRLFHPF
jgi:hypothetical protein